MSNLPAEIAHVLEEIRDKDIKFYETRKRIQQRDNQIHKFIRNHGSLAENPKENSYPKIRSDFEKAMALQQEKCDLANTGLYIVSKHLKRLNDEIKRLEKDGMIAPSSEPIVMDTASAGRLAMNRSRVMTGTVSTPTGGNRKHASPVPGSRANTPSAVAVSSGLASTPIGADPNSLSARPTKRQKLSMSGSALATAGASPHLGSNGHKALNSSRPSVRLVSPGTGTPMTLKSSTPGDSGYLDDKGDHTSAASTPRSGAYSRKENKSASSLGIDGVSPMANSSLDVVTGSGMIDAEDEIYCICRQVSFGNMIGCDNPECKIEWFHYDCVGLKEPPDPKSSWFCPDCVRDMEKKVKENKDAKESKKRSRTN